MSATSPATTSQPLERPVVANVRCADAASTAGGAASTGAATRTAVVELGVAATVVVGASVVDVDDSVVVVAPVVVVVSGVDVVVVSTGAQFSKAPLRYAISVVRRSSPRTDDE